MLRIVARAMRCRVPPLGDGRNGLAAANLPRSGTAVFVRGARQGDGAITDYRMSRVARSALERSLRGLARTGDRYCRKLGDDVCGGEAVLKAGASA